MKKSIDMKIPFHIIPVTFTFSLLLLSCSKPVANFLVEENSLVAPTTIQFSNASKNAEKYYWDFGDGNTSELQNPEHKYFLSGSYEVSLKVIKGKQTNMTSSNITIQAPTDCTVEMQTSLGNITLLLFDNTPRHRDNFIKLAESGYFDNLLFHRVIEGFMIQGGDPMSRNATKDAHLGSGGPSYNIPAEMNSENGHIKGALCAARKGDNVNPEKASSGSQFYIVHGRKLNRNTLEEMERRKNFVYPDNVVKDYLELGGTPFLDQEYTVFGRVVNGLDVVDQIAVSKTNASDRPIEDIKILAVKVIK